MTEEELDRINRAEEIQLYTENRCEALEKRIEELEEVRTAQANLLNKDIIRITNLEAANEKIKDQLTEAKDIIKDLLSLGVFGIFKGTTAEEIIVKAENFIKEKNYDN